MGRAKFTVAEKRRHSALMRKAWAARKRAARVAKPATRPVASRRRAEKNLAEAIRAIFR